MPDDDTPRYQTDIVLPLDGLASLNDADDVVSDLRLIAEDSRMSPHRERVENCQSVVSKLDRIQRQIERGGGGCELCISVELRAQEQEDSDE